MRTYTKTYWNRNYRPPVSVSFTCEKQDHASLSGFLGGVGYTIPKSATRKAFINRLAQVVEQTVSAWPLLNRIDTKEID